MRRSIFMVVLLLLMGGLIACSSNTAEEATVNPTVIQERFQRNTEIAVSTLGEQTQIAIRAGTLPVLTSTATIDPARIVTFTPVPTVNVDDPNDPLGNTYSEQSWQQVPFITPDNRQIRVSDYTDMIVFIHVMDTSCENCEVVALEILDAAENLAGIAGDRLAVLISLNVNTQIRPDSFGFTMAERGLGADENLNWVLGTATDDLLAAMQYTFGEDSLNPENLPLIFVDTQGNAHISLNELQTSSFIRDTIIGYITPEGVPTAVSTEPMAEIDLPEPSATPTEEPSPLATETPTE